MLTKKKKVGKGLEANVWNKMFLKGLALEGK